MKQHRSAKLGFAPVIYLAVVRDGLDISQS